MQVQKKASSSEDSSDSDKKKKKRKSKDKKKKDKKKKKKVSSSSESSSSVNESSSTGPDFQEAKEGIPGFVYEVDKLGNRIISRAPPDLKKKRETKKSKAMGNYNQILNDGPP
jgi:hypothetical protein